MQLPQLYRRGVVRPLDKHAADQLATFSVKSPIRVEWLTVLSDDQFYEIWDSGVLQRINEACGIEISDYEEVDLNSSFVPKALQVLEKVEVHSGDVFRFIDGLKSLLAEAVACGSNVYFIF